MHIDRLQTGHNGVGVGGGQALADGRGADKATDVRRHSGDQCLRAPTTSGCRVGGWAIARRGSEERRASATPKRLELEIQNAVPLVCGFRRVLGVHFARITMIDRERGRRLQSNLQPEQETETVR